VNCSLPTEVPAARFEVFTALKIQVEVFWSQTRSRLEFALPCSIDVYCRLLNIRSVTTLMETWNWLQRSAMVSLFRFATERF